MLGLISTLFSTAKRKVVAGQQKDKLIAFMNNELSMSQRMCISPTLGAVYRTRYERPYTNALKTGVETATIDAKITRADVRREEPIFYGTLIVNSSSDKENIFKYNKDIEYNGYGSPHFAPVFEGRSTTSINGFGRFILSLEYVKDLTVTITDEVIRELDTTLSQLNLDSEVRVKWQKIKESL